MMQARMRQVVWVMLGVLALMLSAAAFRGYLNPDFLLGFANTFSC